MEKYRIGRRFCALADAQEFEIEATSHYAISPRRKIPLHRLSSGDIIAEAQKKLEVIPSDVTGVLLKPLIGKSKWQWHAKQEAFATRFQADPATVVSDITASWVGAFRFKTEVADDDVRVAPGKEGLLPRPGSAFPYRPKLGALDLGQYSAYFLYAICIGMSRAGR